MITQFNPDAYDPIEKFRNDITVSISAKYSVLTINYCRMVKPFFGESIFTVRREEGLYHPSMLLDIVKNLNKNTFNDIFRLKRYMRKKFPDLYHK